MISYQTGDVLNVLATLPPGSVDLVLTSPPFLALRSYLPDDHPDKALEGGQEETPGEFIDWLLDVVEACDRVLAPHGSMCFELGDTYAGSGTRDEGGSNSYRAHSKGDRSRGGDIRALRRDVSFGWPADKSLTLIPETFRFALAYGTNPHTGRQTKPWRVRNVVRWVRPNPTVGALGDKFRPATSEMVVFCRTDQAGRRRYFDLDAVREPHTVPNGKQPAGMNSDSGVEWSEGERLTLNPAGAPPRDWWEIPTHPYKGAHYATWPPDLCVKPIKAMSPERVCVTCGEPSRRVVETEPHRLRPHLDGQQGGVTAGVDHTGDTRFGTTITTLGWTDCGHDTWRPGTVLDPFAGSGTTLAVAIGHGRNAIGIDLDERNVELARQRVGPMFFTWANET